MNVSPPSRAQCRVDLVCSPCLLEADVKTVDQMQCVSALTLKATGLFIKARVGKALQGAKNADDSEQGQFSAR